MKLLSTIFAITCLFSVELFGTAYVPVALSYETSGQRFQEIVAPDTSAMLLISPFYLDIVAPSSGIQFYRNGIIFLAYSKEEEKVPEKHLSFGTLETFTAKIMDTVPGEFSPLQFAGSSIFPSEATTFSQDYSTMYLSLIPPRASREKIFRASLQSNKWVVDKEPLSFCKNDFLYTHPTLSADGTFMIFSSDLTGSSGNLDLFITRKEKDKWSNPENLGRHINTGGNEVFASLDANNNLYFSSDGIPGNGGYDVFLCRYNGQGWDKPVNLSKINNVDDDLAFTINRKDNMSAFYTSRSRSGKNRTQLYHITLKKPTATKANGDLSYEFFALAGAITQPKIKVTEPANLTAQTTMSSEMQIKRPPAEHPTETMINGPAKTETVIKEKTSDRIEEPKVPDKISPVTNQSEKIKPDDLIYRIQISSDKKPSGTDNITIAGNKYPLYEYYYKNAYRRTIGEFSTLKEAGVFQNLCRKNGYSQAFVAAFSGDERITDQEARQLETSRKEKPPVAARQEPVRPAPAITAKSDPEASAAETRSNTPTDESKPQENEKVVYRVQVLANTKPVGSYVLTVAGNDYRTYEYLYMGGYRTTIGEFSSLSEAARLQNTCRQNGYKQAFVVAFRNNTRTNDPELFK